MSHHGHTHGDSHGDYLPTRQFEAVSEEYETEGVRDAEEG
jgi:hypothetical protein